MKFNVFLLLFGVMVFSACSIFQHDKKTERTFPQAFNFRSATLQQLQDKVTPPDSVNIECYVVEIDECPDNAYCFLPDAIVISDTLHPVYLAGQYRLDVYKPSQFEQYAYYKLSIEVGTYPGNGARRVNLLGYSRLALPK